jgi:hypothetical protein
MHLLSPAPRIPQVSGLLAELRVWHADAAHIDALPHDVPRPPRRPAPPAPGAAASAATSCAPRANGSKGAEGRGARGAGGRSWCGRWSIQTRSPPPVVLSGHAASLTPY